MPKCMMVKAQLFRYKLGQNPFKNRMVELGMEIGDRIEIKSGLKEGDVIVITGAYLINSEYIFKNGADPMAGMKMWLAQ